MRFAIEVLGPKRFQNHIDRVVLEQDSAEDRRFRLEVLRRDFAYIVVYGCHGTRMVGFRQGATTLRCLKLCYLNRNDATPRKIKSKKNLELGRIFSQAKNLSGERDFPSLHYFGVPNVSRGNSFLSKKMKRFSAPYAR